MRLGLVLVFFSLFAPRAFAQENVYVGSDRCRSCHQKAYEIWAKSAHAFSQQILPEEKRAELRCLFCHATDVQANLLSYKFENVQCEACHGPGSRHITLAMKDPEKVKVSAGLESPGEQRCRVCHGDLRSSRLRPFSYETALQKIRHW